MGYVYVVTNTKNNRQYVGATTIAPEVRWQQQINDSKNIKKERVILVALREFGPEAFDLATVEIVRDDQLHEREQYWRQKLNTEVDGYNMKPLRTGKRKREAPAVSGAHQIDPPSPELIAERQAKNIANGRPPGTGWTVEERRFSERPKKVKA